MKPLVDALHRKPVDRPPIWIMRQAGRYLPEYRALRDRVSFREAVSNPEIAAEITLQPVRRFGMDGAVIFADIMTPLEAMGVGVEYAPGPVLRPHTLEEVASLSDPDPDRVGFVAETIRRVAEQVPEATAVIGFCGSPVTLLAYLLEGGGSKEFTALRRTLLAQPDLATRALERLARAMITYLRIQVEAGADVVQLFDSWAGILDRERFTRFAVPAARLVAAGVPVPTIYFAPGAAHALDLFPLVEATGYGIDWRMPIDQAWDRIGDFPVQGNLDPAVLLTDPPTIRKAVWELLARTEGRPGHIVNLGHGIRPETPPEHVAVLVEAVRE